MNKNCTKQKYQSNAHTNFMYININMAEFSTKFRFMCIHFVFGFLLKFSFFSLLFEMGHIFLKSKFQGQYE